MIETTVKELSDADCIICEDESALMPINGGKISTYYYIDIGTVNWFLSKVSNKSDYRVLMEIVSSANEFESVDVRKGEENILKTLHYEAFYKIKKPNYLKASTKVYLLLQAVSTYYNTKFKTSNHLLAYEEKKSQPRSLP